MEQNPDSSILPIQGNLSRDVTLTLVVAILMASVSIGSLIFSSTIYPTEELFQSFGINDVINIVVGVPILLGSLWLAKQDKLAGLLLWPGALLYVLYNYIVYVFGIPFNWLTLAYVLVVLLSGYGIFTLLRKIDNQTLRDQLTGRVPVKFASWVLLLFGIVFIFRAISIIIETMTNQTMLPTSEIGLLIADLVISTVWIGGGVSLLRRKPLGYAGGLGLLFAGSMLFIGLILVLIIQPILLDTPFVLSDVIVVIIMGMICFIPFGLFLRGGRITGFPRK
jgi:hypothetical protein